MKITAEEFEEIREDDSTITTECEKHHRHNGSRYEYVFPRNGKFYMFSLWWFEDNGVDTSEFPIDAYEVKKIEVIAYKWVHV